MREAQGALPAELYAQKSEDFFKRATGLEPATTRFEVEVTPIQTSGTQTTYHTSRGCQRYLPKLPACLSVYTLSRWGLGVASTSWANRSTWRVGDETLCGTNASSDG